MPHAFTQKTNVPVSIINTSSRNGVNMTSSKRPIYARSKSFILFLTQTIASQAAQKGRDMGRTVTTNEISNKSFFSWLFTIFVYDLI